MRRAIKKGSYMHIEYELIRSNRKTLCAEIKDGRLIIRAPRYASKADIDIFIRNKLTWIEEHLQKSRSRMEQLDSLPKLSEDEIRALARQAMKVIPERVAYYAPLIGVTYGRITIRNQKTRWGSCSSKGNLNFNCLLMLTPPEVIDSVVVHELCHRKEMNHSDRFYSEVLRVFPEYHKWNRWLKENGGKLIGRM